MNETLELNLTDIPLSDFVGLLENFISKVGSGDENSGEDIKLQAKGFIKLLNNKLETLTNGQRRGKSEQVRDRIVLIFEQLREISGEYSKEVVSTFDFFTERSLSFLGNYGFMKCENIEDLEKYLDLDEHKIDVWNSIKFNSFLKHLSKLNDFDAKKSDFLLIFLNFDSVKSCDWMEESYGFMAQVIKRAKNKNKKAELKRLFNGLSGIQKDRRKGNINNPDDPWNTLFYESQMRGREEAFGYTDSGLGRLPGKMGVILAKGQPPK